MAGSSGQIFGKYQLYERIAAGGMAEIYRAKLVGAAGVTKNVVVKKILPSYAQDPSFVAMFINEARIAMTLAHGNIAQVVDFGEIDGEYFIAMEYVQGPALSKVLRRAEEKAVGVPVPLATYIGLEMCKGLHYAHTRLGEDGKPLGIVHRDISPQNVILSYEGQVKIVDFGIAKSKAPTEIETEAGAIKGKFLYFSPEQASGKPLDPRTDVFATGIVLYEMVTGRRPFAGEAVTVIRQIAEGQFAPPSDIVPEIPEELEDVILTAMATDPAERFPSAQALQEALGQVLYTHAPRFHGEIVGHYVRWLFQEEVAQEMGRAPTFPRDFLEQIPLWKPPPPRPRAAPQQPSDTVTERPPAPLPSGRRLPSSPKERRRASSMVSMPGQPAPPVASRKTLLAGLAIALALPLAGVGAWALVGPNRGNLTVKSDPAGAAIFLDGRDTGAATGLEGTRVVIDAEGEHKITLRALGYEPFIATLQFQKGTKGWNEQVLDAKLIRTAVKKPPPPPPPPPAPDAGPVETKLPPREPPFSGTSDTLDLAREVINVPKSNAAHKRLDPTHAYKLTVRGTASAGGIGNAIKIYGVWYYGRGPGKTVAGVLSPKSPASLSGVRDLWAFIVDDNAGDNTGNLDVTFKDVTAGGEGADSMLRVSAHKNCVEIGTRNSMRIDADQREWKCSGTHRCDITVAPGKLQVGPGGVPRVAYQVQMGLMFLGGMAIRGEEAWGLVEPGKSVTPAFPWEFAFFFVLDDDPKDNVGNIKVTVEMK